jgi:hypothetical protein
MTPKLKSELSRELIDTHNKIAKELKPSIPETDLLKRVNRLRLQFLNIVNIVDEIRIDDPTFYKTYSPKILDHLNKIASRLLQYSVLISSKVFLEVLTDGIKIDANSVVLNSGLSKKIYATFNADLGKLKTNLQHDVSNIYLLIRDKA